MILRPTLSAFLFVSLSTWAQVPGESDELSIQRDSLSSTLEQPLRTHLLRNGLTPRNATIAASNLIDSYARCLASTPPTDSPTEPELTFFRIGDASVAAYKSPCLNEFLADIAGIT